jgi:hypothetical protein
MFCSGHLLSVANSLPVACTRFGRVCPLCIHVRCRVGADQVGTIVNQIIAINPPQLLADIIILIFSVGADEIADSAVESTGGFVLSKSQQKIQQKAIDKRQKEEEKQLDAERKKQQKKNKKKKSQEEEDAGSGGDGGSDGDDGEGDMAKFDNPLVDEDDAEL